MRKILNVAEKNDAAKTISRILSGGQTNFREGYSKFNKIYSFPYAGFLGDRSQVEMIFTSVSGHLSNYEFPKAYRHWQQVNPVRLFEAPVEKKVTQSSEPIKRTLEREARQAKSLVIWTDCDREGENIGFEIINVCLAVNRNLTVHRAKFSDMTPGSIRRAVSTLGQPNRHVSEAVDCRQELDLRIGAAFTRFQTLRLQRAFPTDLQDKVISYGSCQFPTLGFVVERYKAIQSFVAEPFWRLSLKHTKEGQLTEFGWERGKLFEKLPVECLLDRCRESNRARVISVDSKPKSRWRPLALDTVELEKLASRKCRISAQKTMQIAEALYQKGYISYPRTETNKFPPDLNLRALVAHHTGSNLWGGFAQKVLDRGPNPRNGTKTDQAHPPIHPTNFKPDLAGDDGRIYELIVRHFLACVSWNAEGFETTVRCDLADEKFRASGLLVTERGFLEVYPYVTWADRSIPVYSTNEEFTPDSIDIVESQTQAPKLLSEADLIALMEKHGIGTDATHAEHIEKIKQRLYVGLTPDQRFQPGYLGLGLVDGYDSMGPWHMSKPRLRAELEEGLKQICEGRRTRDELLREQIAQYRRIFEIAVEKATSLDEALSDYFGRAAPVPTPALGGPGPPGGGAGTHGEPFVGNCAACTGPMTLREKREAGNPGSILGGKFYVGCLGFPACREAVWLPNGVISARVLDDLCTTHACAQRSIHLLHFTLRPPAFPVPVPSQYRGCIFCDPELALWFEIDRNSTAPRKPPDPPGPRPPQMPFSTPKRDGNSGVFPGQQMTATPGQFPTPNIPRTLVRPLTNQGVRTPEQSNVWPLVADAGSSSNNNVNCDCGQLAMLRTCANGRENHGREFFKCPSGRCDFFKWKDEETRVPIGRKPISTGGGDSLFPSTSNFTSPRQENPSTSSAVESIVCNCGSDAKLLTVRKEGPNTGRQFYACPKGQPGQGGCGFFAWADEGGTPTGGARGGGGQEPHKRGDGNPRTCNCGVPAVQRSVKSGQNTGKDYLACSKGREGGCGFFEWTDALGARRPSSNRGGGGTQKRPRSATPGAATGGPRAPRKCSYCRKEGHTVRNCADRMERNDDG